MLPRRALLLLFIGALVLRLAHALAMSDSPYFGHPVIDGQEYVRAAIAIARGKGHPDPVYWHPPGYPYFLASIWSLSRGGYLLPRVLQACLGALVVVFTAWMGTRSFGRRVGMAAGVGASLYGILIYFDGEILAASLGVFLVVGAAVLGMLAKQRGSRLLWAAAGLGGGAATLTVASSVIVPLLLAVHARRRFPWVLLGLAVAVAPATLHNYRHGKEFVLVSYNGGINFWIGNNPQYDRMVSVRPDADWLRLVNEPARAGVAGRAAASAYFARKVLRWAANDPAGFLRLQAHKLRLLLSGNEIFRNQAIYPARQHSPILRVLLWKVPGLAFPFGFLLPLAGLGLWVGARRAPLPAALVAGLAAMVLLFFVTARYRVPLVPFLLVFAAAGGEWLVRQASRLQRLAAASAMTPLFLLANLGQGPMDSRMNADAEYSLATSLGEEGRMAEAMALFESTVASRPSYGEAWMNLSVCYEHFGRAEEARAAMKRAYDLDPAFTVEAIHRFKREGKAETAARLECYLREAAGASAPVRSP